MKKYITLNNCKKAVKIIVIGAGALFLATFPRTIGSVLINLLLYGFHPILISCVISGFQLIWLFCLAKRIRLLKKLVLKVWSSNYFDLIDPYWDKMVNYLSQRDNDQ